MAKAHVSQWQFYILAAIGMAWLFQGLGLFDSTLPLGPIAMVWASLSLLLLSKQLSR